MHMDFCQLGIVTTTSSTKEVPLRAVHSQGASGGTDTQLRAEAPAKDPVVHL